MAERLEQIFGNFRANPKDFGLTNKEIEKRRQQLNQVLTERTNLQRQYDSYFQKKSKNDLLGNESSDKNKPDYTKMNSRDLSQHKAKQEQEQEEAIEDLVNVVKNIKQGQKGINQELHEQDGALNVQISNIRIVIGSGNGREHKEYGKGAPQHDEVTGREQQLLFDFGDCSGAGGHILYYLPVELSDNLSFSLASIIYDDLPIL